LDTTYVKRGYRTFLHSRSFLVGMVDFPMTFKILWLIVGVELTVHSTCLPQELGLAAEHSLVKASKFLMPLVPRPLVSSSSFVEISSHFAQPEQDVQTGGAMRAMSAERAAQIANTEAVPAGNDEEYQDEEGSESETTADGAHVNDLEEDLEAPSEVAEVPNQLSPEEQAAEEAKKKAQWETHKGYFDKSMEIIGGNVVKLDDHQKNVDAEAVNVHHTLVALAHQQLDSQKKIEDASHNGEGQKHTELSKVVHKASQDDVRAIKQYLSVSVAKASQASQASEPTMDSPGDE